MSQGIDVKNLFSGKPIDGETANKNHTNPNIYFEEIDLFCGAGTTSRQETISNKSTTFQQADDREERE